MTDPEAVGLVAKLVEYVFPGPSENAICDRASAVLCCDPGVIRRLLRKETKNPSFALVWALIRVGIATGKDPFKSPAFERLKQDGGLWP